METKTGRIVTLKLEKGYGFIKPDEEGKENVFFHCSRVLSPNFDVMKMNERVEYLEEKTLRGSVAADVVVI